jgi:hypothetical protein
MALVRIAEKDLRVGAPLDFAVYTATGKLLINQGGCIRSENQRDRLVAMGGFRDAESAQPGKRAPAQESLIVSTASHDRAIADARPVAAPSEILPKNLERLQLTVVARPDAALQVEFVGSISGTALVVAVLTGFEFLEPEVEVECKALLGRKIYRFHTVVTGRNQSPAQVVYLAHPDAVTAHVVRKHPRIATSMAARLIRNDCIAAGFDVTVVNVSMGGASLRASDRYLKIGEHFKLALRLRAEGKVHAVVFHCIARNSRPTDGGVLIGVEFSGFPNDARSLLKTHMFETATSSHL